MAWQYSAHATKLLRRYADARCGRCLPCPGSLAGLNRKRAEGLLFFRKVEDEGTATGREMSSERSNVDDFEEEEGVWA